MLGAGIGCELAFELGDFRSENIAPIIDDALDGCLQSVTDAFALGAEIDELHGLFQQNEPEIGALVTELARPEKRQACVFAWPGTTGVIALRECRSFECLQIQGGSAPGMSYPAQCCNAET
jgi:hypothetical protein